MWGYGVVGMGRDFLIFTTTFLVMVPTFTGANMICRHRSDLQVMSLLRRTGTVGGGPTG